MFCMFIASFLDNWPTNLDLKVWPINASHQCCCCAVAKGRGRQPGDCPRDGKMPVIGSTLVVDSWRWSRKNPLFLRGWKIRGTSNHHKHHSNRPWRDKWYTWREYVWIIFDIDSSIETTFWNGLLDVETQMIPDSLIRAEWNHLNLSMNISGQSQSHVLVEQLGTTRHWMGSTDPYLRRRKTWWVHLDRSNGDQWKCLKAWFETDQPSSRVPKPSPVGWRQCEALRMVM